MKGISPLIAAVLLIAFTVTAAVLIITWGTSFTTSTTSGVGNKSTEIVECSGAAIEIDSVYINNNTGIANVIVKNTGVREITISSAMLTNKTGGNFQNTTTFTLNRGAIGTIQVTGVQVGPGCSDYSKTTILTYCPGISAIHTTTPTCSS
ncbi:MAG: archaellin/type IV pilin N-terminal domain-containing protein [Candidatus Aenigmatarchaeota archaeon]